MHLFSMKRCTEISITFYVFFYFSRALHPSAHLRVARHDGVVAVVIERGCSGVQRAGSISVTADPVVLAPLGDLLAIFKPVDL